MQVDVVLGGDELDAGVAVTRGDGAGQQADGLAGVDSGLSGNGEVGVFATGQGRKTDATDAHSVALIGTRVAGLGPVVNDAQLTVLRVLVDRRRSLGEEHTRKVNQLHALLLELIPAGAKKYLSGRQARLLLEQVNPTDPAGQALKRVAVEYAADLEHIYARTKDADKELKTLVAQTGTGLLDLHGIGPSGAARLLVAVGQITRFPTKAHFASWTGTAPIDASSGDHVRHRLSRGGNREINRVLHTMAIVQLRTRTTLGRSYYDRKRADGKTAMEALRCLKRRLSDVVYRTMLTDYTKGAGAGPGGHQGASTGSSAAGSQPHTDTSKKSLPEPAGTDATTPTPQSVMTPLT